METRVPKPEYFENKVFLKTIQRKKMGHTTAAIIQK